MTALAPTFRKQERMVSKLLIEALFNGSNSHSVSAFPLKAVYQTMERFLGTLMRICAGTPSSRRSIV